MGGSKVSGRVLAVAIVIATAGCRTSAPEVADPRDCFPKSAQPWIHVDKDATAQPGASKKDVATIYVDHSGSMVGYLKGATATERPLQDLIGTLPATLSAERFSTRYRTFGRRISAPMSDAEVGMLMNPTFYTCQTGARECDSQESHLDAVLSEIARSKSGLSLVITDLWFSNSDVQTTALSALAEPLTDILANGRAVAVYGLSAPFNGRIYDLPYATAPVQFQGKHPLFLVAIGTDQELASFHEELSRSPSPYLEQGLSSGALKRTLFTLSPAVPGQVPADPLTVGTDARISAEPVLEGHANLRVQEFHVNSDEAVRREGNAAPPFWVGPKAAAFVPDSVWQGEYEPKVRIWERRDTTCTAGDWIEGRPIEGLWGKGGGQTWRFSLDPEKLATELGREGTYLVQAEIGRTKVLTPSPASNWLRQWGFTPEQQSPAREEGGAAFYPTLHLGEVARLMENALAEASRRRPDPIFGFAVVVKLDS
jgi:hypothetical protein